MEPEGLHLASRRKPVALSKRPRAKLADWHFFSLKDHARRRSRAWPTLLEQSLKGQNNGPARGTPGRDQKRGQTLPVNGANPVMLIAPVKHSLHTFRETRDISGHCKRFETARIAIRDRGKPARGRRRGKRDNEIVRGVVIKWDGRMCLKEKVKADRGSGGKQV